MINCLSTYLLKKLLVIGIDDDAEKLLEARFVRESDENYPKYALHIHAKNEPAIKRNEAVLDDLLGELHKTEALNKIPDICKYPLTTIQAAQNQKQANTGGLAKLLKFKIGVKIMLTVNVDKQDRPINDQQEILYILSNVCKIYVRFSDEQAGLKAMRKLYLGRQTFLGCY